MLLSELIGQGVKDIEGYVTDPFGSGPLFEISYIIMQDGSHLWCGGAHDCPYVELDSEYDEKLEALMEEEEE